MRKLHWQPQSQRQRQHRRQRQRKAICLIAYRRFMASVWRQKKQREKVGLLVMVLVMVVLVLLPRDEVYLVTSADFN